MNTSIIKKPPRFSHTSSITKIPINLRKKQVQELQGETPVSWPSPTNKHVKGLKDNLLGPTLQVIHGEDDIHESHKEHHRVGVHRQDGHPKISMQNPPLVGYGDSYCDFISQTSMNSEDDSEREIISQCKSTQIISKFVIVR